MLLVIVNNRTTVSVSRTSFFARFQIIQRCDVMSRYIRTLRPLTLLIVAMAFLLCAFQLNAQQVSDSSSSIFLTPTELTRQIDDGVLASDSEPHLCGLYSLVFFLRMLDHDVNVDEVRDMLTITVTGSNLRDLAAAGRTNGVSTACVFCSPQHLDRLPLPAIAHLEPSDAFPIAHYVVLLSLDDNTVAFFDWNTRHTGRCERSEFARLLSGYFIVRQNSTVPLLMEIEEVAVLVAAGLGIGFVHLIRRNGKRRHTPNDRSC
jgi:hypothetical protein